MPRTLLPPKVKERRRTVWTPAGLDGRADDKPQRSDGSYAFQHVHQARVQTSANYQQVTGWIALGTGVKAKFGIAPEENREGQNQTDTRTALVYQFDAAIFTPDAAEQWLADHSVEGYEFEPDQRQKPAESASIVQGGANARSDEGGELHVRTATIQPASWNGEQLSVDAVIATDDPIFSFDVKANKPVHEVWLQGGLEFDKHVPLIDNHDRSTVRKILGSVLDHRVGAHQTESKLVISRAEPEVATKVREGHIKEVSAGGMPLETVVVPAGMSREIRGRVYTARPDQPLFVHLRFRIREVSLTTKGADQSTQIRSTCSSDERSHKMAMKERMRKFLERLGMSRSASDEDAQKWHDKLPEETRAKCRAYSEEEDEEDDEDDDEDEDDEEKEEKAEKRRSKRERAERKRSAELERVRSEAAVAERQRQMELRRIGQGLPDETIRKAIDDGLSVEAAAPVFLEAVRTRTESAGADGRGFFIHSRSHATDCTAEVLGAALSLRSLSRLQEGETGYSQASNPVNLFGGYEPMDGVIRSDTDWVFRPNRSAETRKQQVERMLERADRYANMAIMDMCRECCRMDGKTLSSWAPQEVIRAAVSGGSFGAIFTTSFNALFLAGYLDATDTTLGWTTESDMPNFLPGERATVGKMGQLTLDGVGKPADHMTFGDWNEPIRLHRFTGQYLIDEKDLINDRFGALQTWSPQELGLTARQMRPNLVYSTLLNNPVLNQDSVALFSTATSTNRPVANMIDSNAQAGTADLYNYRKSDGTLLNPGDPAGAVYVEPIQRAISTISEQRIAGRPLNLRPRFMLMAPKLRWGGAVLFQSAERVIASGSGGTFNPLRDLGIEPRDDARLNATGCWDPLANAGQGALVAGKDYHWILVCRPGEEGAKTLEVVYLQGTGRAPQIRSFVMGGPGMPGRWGIGWDVKHDIGVAPIDFRGFFYGKTIV